MSNYRIIKYIIYTILITLSAGLLAVGDPSIDMGSGPLNVITGVVLDQNKMGVANANVIIPQKNISVSTSGDGTFTARFEGSGKIHIEVIKNGFMPFATKPIALKAKMSIQHQTIVLHESLLEEVVVTGTSTPKLYRETPVKTSVASKSEIEKKGAVSLADSLEIVNGVRVEDNCSNCNFTQVRINGMEGKYSQILIDGQPVVSALAGVYALEQIPANMIEKLEVVKGGGSALYGGNAVAGVVNVVTKDPANSGSRIALTQESISSKPNTSLNLNRDFVSKSQNTVLSLFTNYQKRDHADYNGDGFSDLGQLKNLSLGSNFSHYFNKINGKLRLRVNYISEDRRGGNKFELPEHMADIAESVNTKRSDMGLGWEQTFSLTSILKFNASLSYTQRKSYYGAQQDPNAYGETSNPVLSGNIVYNNFSVKDHSFVRGISYKSDSFIDNVHA
ncbi:MAG: TonB-dependent receptor plug domain-containing protein, partial [bacterium]|nr:TonB-dependent receptor plug domain-containing protein [bacterium]